MKKRDPLNHPERCQPARVFRVHPDMDRRQFVVEVRIARNMRRMREAMVQAGFPSYATNDTEGHVISRTHNPRGRLYNGRIVARMFLNQKGLRQRPSEIVAHECAHAAMAWARLRKADLSKMGHGTWKKRKSDGEELLCYSVGELVEQVSRVCFSAGVWEK